MDDISIFQWLVLGLLSLIAFMIWAIAGGMDRNMEALTRRNEDAASSIRVAIEHLTDVVRSKPPEDDASLLSLLDEDGDVLAKLERARERIKLRGDAGANQGEGNEGNVRDCKHTSKAWVLLALTIVDCRL